METAFILGDIHGRYRDGLAFDIALDLIKDIQPSKIIINGDLIDFYAISHFGKDPERSLELQNEIDDTNDILDKIQEVSGSAKIEWVEGNHERRLRNYLWSSAPELACLRSLTMKSLFFLGARNIDYIESKGKSAYTKFGNILIGHWDIARQDSCASARAILVKNSCSIVQGHTHRLGMFYKTYRSQGKQVVGCEGGCLCQLDPEYCSDPDWQAGVTIIYKLDGKNRFHIIQIPIVKHEALFNGKIYR